MLSADPWLSGSRGRMHWLLSTARSTQPCCGVSHLPVSALWCLLSSVLVSSPGTPEPAREAAPPSAIWHCPGPGFWATHPALPNGVAALRPCAVGTGSSFMGPIVISSATCGCCLRDHQAVVHPCIPILPPHPGRLGPGVHHLLRAEPVCTLSLVLAPNSSDAV